MNWTVVITTLVNAVVLGLLAVYLNKGFTKQIPIHKNGSITLRMHKLYHIVGIISMGIPALMMATTFFVDEEGVYVPLFFITLMFGGMGLMCLKYYHHHRLTFDNQRVMVTDWKGKTQIIEWNDVIEIKQSSNSECIEIYTASNKLSIHNHLVGLGVFVKTMEAKTEWRGEDVEQPL